jgi:L,D-transpeptidase catalytic domain
MSKILKSISLITLTLSFITLPVLMSGKKLNNHGQKYTSEVVTIKPYVVDAKLAIIAKGIALYDSMQLDKKGLKQEAFQYAWKGYQYLLSKNLITRKQVLSVCDFSQSSRNRRLYVIDVDDYKVLVNTYVAHGRNSGAEYANSFSNKDESHKSSLGFYVTRNTYYGEHGLSLKIDGIEKGFNDRAMNRNIVIHGSTYVGDKFVASNKFNGRSFGCPAVPDREITQVINTIKNGTCLFIYHPTKQYITKSKILNS